MNDLFAAPTLTELFQQGADTELGAIDGVTFSSLTIVAQKSAQGTEFHFYCLMRDWQNEAAYHLLNAQVVIASQQEQLQLVNTQLENALRQVEQLTKANHTIAYLEAENSRMKQDLTAFHTGKITTLNSHIVPLRPHKPRSTYCPCESCEALRQAAQDHSEGRANGLPTFPEVS